MGSARLGSAGMGLAGAGWAVNGRDRPRPHRAGVGSERAGRCWARLGLPGLGWDRPGSAGNSRARPGWAQLQWTRPCQARPARPGPAKMTFTGQAGRGSNRLRRGRQAWGCPGRARPRLQQTRAGNFWPVRARLGLGMLGQAQPRSVRYCPARPGSTQPSLAEHGRAGQAGLHPAEMGPAGIDRARPGAAETDSAGLGPARPGSAELGRVGPCQCSGAGPGPTAVSRFRLR